MTDQRTTMLAADCIRELIKPRTITLTQPRFVPIPDIPTLAHAHGWARLTELVPVTHPPLLDQLVAAISQAPAGGAHGGGVATSKPSARLEAIDVLQRINHGSRALAEDLQLAPTTDLATRLSRISGAIGDTDDKTIRGWWVAARVTTNWEQAPFAPNIPCPEITCERWGTLRIRVDSYLARCTACAATWDEPLYAALGAYIRWAADHLTTPRHWILTSTDLIECTECLTVRQEMAQRQVERAVAAKHEHRHGRRGVVYTAPIGRSVSKSSPDAPALQNYSRSYGVGRAD